MRWHRVSAIMLHTLYHFRHSRETWVDLGWSPVINIFVIGGLSTYFVLQGNLSPIQFITLAIIFWHVIEIGSYSIAVGALWEVWAKSFSNLFITPLSVEEFVIGQIVFSLVKQLLLIIVLSTVAGLVFHAFLLTFGILLPVYFLLLAMYGWAFGMFVLGLILRFGTNIQSLSWSLIFILQPFIGIFYPIRLLPQAIQRVALIFAPTYVFEAARLQFETGLMHIDYLLKAAILDIIALIIGYYFMKYMWEWARKTGALARMEQ